MVASGFSVSQMIGRKSIPQSPPAHLQYAWTLVAVVQSRPSLTATLHSDQ